MLEGRTINNLLVFGDLNNGAVTKGYKIQLPFLGNSHDKDLNEWHDKLRCLLKNLSEEEMLHIYYLVLITITTQCPMLARFSLSLQ